MQEVITALRESDEWPDGELTNKEVAKETSVGDRQVAELMKELEEEGYVTHRRGGRGNAYHWSDVCLDQVATYGRVDQG
jgi:Mn-dependent DtxR family transcriptional regulator